VHNVATAVCIPCGREAPTLLDCAVHFPNERSQAIQLLSHVCIDVAEPFSTHRFVLPCVIVFRRKCMLTTLFSTRRACNAPILARTAIRVRVVPHTDLNSDEVTRYLHHWILLDKVGSYFFRCFSVGATLACVAQRAPCWANTLERPYPVCLKRHIDISCLRECLLPNFDRQRAHRPPR
jgi:hypothetical protein